MDNSCSNLRPSPKHLRDGGELNTPNNPKIAHGSVMMTSFNDGTTCAAYRQLVAISNKKILIVEDNEPLRQLVTFFLSSSGYEVFEAADGLEALNRATDVRPDLILMDLSLPKITGSEVIRLLKENPLTREIPVVVETAFDSGEETQRAFQAGALDVLHKPLALRFLSHVIRRYVSLDDRKLKSPPRRDPEIHPSRSARVLTGRVG